MNNKITTCVNVKVKYIRPFYNNLKEWMEDENNVYIGRKGVVFIDGKRFRKKTQYGIIHLKLIKIILEILLLINISFTL